MMEDLSKYKKDYILFLEAGFIAINQADEDSAVKLFKACDLLWPNHHLTKVGYGYLHLHKLEIKQACNYFKEALQIDPYNEMAETLLGVALSLSVEEGMKGEQILEEKLKKTSDEQIKTVCNATLDFANTFVKKAPGPAEIKQKRK